MANRPKGSRLTCKIKIGNQTFYSEVKAGTQKLLGLEVVSEELKGDKGKAKGIKGTQSYRLLLAEAHTVGEFQGCVSVDIPISPKCKLRQVYKWAHSHNVLAGIVTPQGIKYCWKNPAKRSKNLLQKAIDGGGNLIKDVTSAANTVGDLIQGAENVAGTIGGYIDGVEGLTGDAITAAEELGAYLL